jgi:hypothetical protein
MNAALTPTVSLSDQAAAAAQKVMATMGPLASSEDVAAAAAQAHGDKLVLMREASIAANEKLFILADTVRQLRDADDGSAPAHQRYLEALTAETAAAADASTKHDDLAAANLAAAAATKAADGAALTFGITMMTTESATDDATNAIGAIPAVASVAQQSIDALASSFDTLGTSATTMAQDIQSIQSDMSQGTGGGSAGTFNLYTPEKGGYVMSHNMWGGLDFTYQPPLAKQQSGTEAAAGDAANPKSSTDQVALLKQILAEAQAKLADITSNFQAHLLSTTAAQVQSAQQAVATAQANLDKAMGASTAVGAVAAGGSATGGGGTQMITSASGTVLVDDDTNGAMYGQLNEIIQLLGGPANFAPAISSAVQSTATSISTATASTVAAADATITALGTSTSAIIGVGTSVKTIASAVQDLAAAVVQATPTTHTTIPTALNPSTPIIPAIAGTGGGTLVPGQTTFLSWNFSGANFGNSSQQMVQESFVQALRTAGARF